MHRLFCRCIFFFLSLIVLQSFAQTNEVWTAGDNSYGQQGQASFIPTAIPGVANVTQISSGYYGSLFMVTSSGNLYVLGGNQYQQLGIGIAGGIDLFGVTAQTPTLHNFAGFANSVAFVSTGQVHTCIVLKSGAVYMMGENEGVYMLGIPGASNYPATATPITAGSLPFLEEHNHVVVVGCILFGCKPMERFILLVGISMVNWDWEPQLRILLHRVLPLSPIFNKYRLVMITLPF
jgi:hypothetical protein